MALIASDIRVLRQPFEHMSTRSNLILVRILRGILCAIPGAIVSGVMVGAILRLFPDLQGNKTVFLILFIAMGVVAGGLAAGLGAATGIAKIGAGSGAIMVLILWLLILRHFPEEPQVMFFWAIVTAGPVAVGVIGAKLGSKFFQSQATDRPAPAATLPKP